MKTAPLLVLLSDLRCNMSLGAITHSWRLHQREAFKIVLSGLLLLGLLKTVVTSFIILMVGVFFKLWLPCEEADSLHVA